MQFPAHQIQPPQIEGEPHHRKQHRHHNYEELDRSRAANFFDTESFLDTETQRHRGNTVIAFLRVSAPLCQRLFTWGSVAHGVLRTPAGLAAWRPVWSYPCPFCLSPRPQPAESSRAFPADWPSPPD